MTIVTLKTVSTDIDTADKLYFEPVFLGAILWYSSWKTWRSNSSLGVQTALKLAEKLDRYGIKILVLVMKSLDLAEG